MTYGVIGLAETATLAEAVETLLRSRISALFVFNAEGVLVGVVSEGDLLRRSELGTDQRRPRWFEFLLSGGRLAEAYTHTHGRKIGEVMTPDVVTISEDAGLGEAVDMMLKRKIKRLAVMRSEAVVGVVSRSDLLKGLMASLPRPGAHRTDAEIRSAILAEFDKLGWTPRASVQVEVKDGVVSFTGAITDERLRSGLKVIAENTPGVTAIHDHVAWIEPNTGVSFPSGEDASAPLKSGDRPGG